MTPTSQASRSSRDIGDWLVEYLIESLGLDREEIDIHAPLVELGLSSRDGVVLSGELGDWLGREISPTVVWEYPSIAALSEFLAGPPSPAPAAPSPAPGAERRPPAASDDGIAIVAMGCRMPGGVATPEQLWQLLEGGVDAIREVPAERWDSRDFYDPEPGTPGKTITRWGGFLDGIDQFDPLFFGIAPREASRMDPQQRLLLEVAWETLERAGQPVHALAGTRTGVFIGISSNDYAQRQFGHRALLDRHAGTGNAHSIAANRISYLLGLRGPSMAVDTACSSSLAAVHLACRSVSAGECDLALAGGVNVMLSPDLTIAFSQAGMMARDGRCKTFDAAADGYVRSEGCGVVLLARLADARAAGYPIVAVIRGSATNHDGASNGLTAPSGAAQQEVIREALARAGVRPAQVGYVEAHGTGTELGDAIEMSALRAVLTPERGPEQACVVGSVKSNIGHLEAAAGIAGLMKAALCLQREEIPPQVHVRQLGPRLGLDDARLRIPTERTPWPTPRGARVAGVSAFGFGGTNVHVVLGEAPAVTPARQTTGPVHERAAHVLALSARSEAALGELARRYAAHLSAPLAAPDAPSLADAAFTAATGRTHRAHRLAVVAGDGAQAAAALDAFARGQAAPGVHAGTAGAGQAPAIAFLFSGQGSQYPHMGRALYESEPVFRAALSQCDGLLRPLLPRPLLAVMYPDSGEDAALLDQTLYTQPALFALQYALAMLWRAWGVEPVAVAGHSVGEYMAAHLAGVMSLEAALSLLATRSRLMQRLPAGEGAMVAVFAGEDTVQRALAALADEDAAQVAVAAFNGPAHVVISGHRHAVARVVGWLEEREVQCQALRVSHAFHSPLIEPILDELEAAAGAVRFAAPRLHLLSNVTGAAFAADRVPDAGYWRQHVRSPVRFTDNVAGLVQRGVSAVVEIGPHRTLVQMARRCVPDAEVAWLPSLQRKHEDWNVMLGSLAALHVRGATVDWHGLDRDRARRRVLLPTYPFERKRYWLDPPAAAGPVARAESETMPVEPEMSPAPKPPRLDAILAALRAMVVELLEMPPEQVDVHTSFLEMGADSIVLLDAARRVEQRFGVKLSIRQLFEELTTLAAMAAYLDGVLPPDLVVGSAPAPVATPAPASRPAPAPVPAAATAAPAASDVAGQVVLQQLQLMSQQVAWMRSLGAAVPATDSAPVPATDSAAVPAAVASAPAAAPATAQTPPPRPAGQSSSPFGAVQLSGTPDRTFTPRQQRHLDDLVARYSRRTGRSKQTAARHRAHWGDVRWLMSFRPETKELCYPIVSTRSRGARFWDADDNEYVDISMGFGVNLFGHNPPFLIEPLRARLDRGMELGPQSDMGGEAAERICRLTGMKRVTFCNSGTEAVMTAIRLARAATGRSTIAMFTGSYHGHADATLVVGRMAGGAPQSLPMAAGVPASVAEDALVLPYGEDRSLEVLRERIGDLAAVLVEPVQSRRPDLQPLAFLQSLRLLTREAGVPLVFDEMITGFRAHPGGCQALFGIEADIATYGKVVGGGMPLGVVADRGGFVDRIDGGDWGYGDASFPAVETTFAAGTFCKHPLTMATTVATLRHLEEQGPALQQRLGERTARLVERLDAVFERAGVPVRMARFASVFRFALAGNFSYLYQPLEMDLLFYHLIERGVYVWEGRTCTLSTAHTDEDLDIIVRAVADAVAAMQEGGFWADSPRAPEIGNDAAAKTGISVRPEIGNDASIETGNDAGRDGGDQGFWTRRRGAGSGEHRARRPVSRIDFALAYFGTYDPDRSQDSYRLVLESARLADEQGFTALWFPERHFHAFGGFSPNPSVLAAALARETRRIHLRAGSVVLPLHHPARVVEEWSLVDRLSGGRVGVAMASGWHPRDFVFAPEVFGEHRARMFRDIDTVQRLWRGEELPMAIGGGGEARVRTYPRPVQAELPMWITIVNNPDTYVRAAELGAGVLTNLMGQTIEQLAGNVALYRDTLARRGLDPMSGHVSALVHTFVGDTNEVAREQARRPFVEYLKSSIGLFAGLVKSQGLAIDVAALGEDDREYIASMAYERYVEQSALIGSPEHCRPIVQAIMDAGVDEIACFVDFGVEPDLVAGQFPALGRLRAMTKATTDATTDAPAPAAQILPLTDAQRQLWLLAQIDEAGSIAYNLSMSLRMRGPLQLDALRDAIRQVVGRHQALRARIDPLGEHQRIAPSLDIPLPISELDDVAAGAREEALAAWYERESHAPFDLSAGPLLRTALLRLSAGEHILVLSAHHIVLDGWSLGIVLQEIAAIYSAAVESRALSLPAAVQLGDYVGWYRRLNDSAEMDAHEQYWRERLGGDLPVLDLPADRPRPARRSYQGGREALRLDRARTDALRALARQQRTTLSTILLAIYGAFLHRISGQDDLLIGLPTAGRQGLEGGDTLVSYCSHLLVLRSRATGTQAFPDYLSGLKDVLWAAIEHQDYPFARLLELLPLQRDPGVPPLLGVTFNLERPLAVAPMSGLETSFHTQPAGFSAFDLSLNVIEVEDGLVLYFDYSTDVFVPDTVARLVAGMDALLAGVVADAERPLAALPLLTDGARRQILETWNQPRLAPPDAVPVARAIAAHADARPDHPAAELAGDAGGAHLTYAALVRRSRQLAHRLRALGVAPGVLVGVLLDRSLDTIVALLGILEAGGAYVPMDPEHPPQRLAFVLADTKAEVVITRADLADLLPEHLPSHDVALVHLDRDAGMLAACPDHALAEPAPPHAPAYVIYTSGSTGEPKGVVVAHGTIAEHCHAMVHHFGLVAGDRFHQFASFQFDASIEQILTTLLAGATLVLRGAELWTPDEALEQIAAQRLTVLNIPPGYWQQLEQGWAELLPGGAAQGEPLGVRLLIIGGDAITPAMLACRQRSPLRRARLLNAYGPTEAVITATLFDLGQALAEGRSMPRVPIGRPLSNRTVYVLDRYGNPVPVGMPGELFIGGTALAVGYLGQPALTAERFIPDPFSAAPEARMYRTGDAVRFLPDGTIEFLGRTDHQVKVRGFRIELGEVENALALHPAVREVVVSVWHGQHGGEGGAGSGPGRLVAHVAVDAGNPESLEKRLESPEASLESLENPDALRRELRRHVEDRLPGYMVPSFIVMLPRMPRSPGGKIDRRRLPAPDPAAAADRDYEPPATETQRILAEIWQHALAVPRVGIHDGFFELGGDSLRALQVAAQIRARLEIEVPLGRLFAEPTIANLADYLETLRWAAGAAPEAGDAADRVEEEL